MSRNMISCSRLSHNDTEYFSIEAVQLQKQCKIFSSCFLSQLPYFPSLRFVTHNHVTINNFQKVFFSSYHLLQPPEPAKFRLFLHPLPHAHHTHFMKLQLPCRVISSLHKTFLSTFRIISNKILCIEIQHCPLSQLRTESLSKSWKGYHNNFLRMMNLSQQLSQQCSMLPTQLQVAKC